MEKYEVGNTVVVIMTDKLPGNSVAPPLKMDEEREVKDICLDEDGNQHLDVGLRSEYMYIRSYETSEDLPNGDSIHWCHPSRFKKKV